MKISPPRIWRERYNYYMLRITQCLDCGRASYPTSLTCPYCGSSNIRTVNSSGLGEVITYTISYFRIEGQEDEVPKVIALIKLREGAIVLGEVVDVGLSEIREGLEVEAVLRRLKIDGNSGLIWYGMKFRPIIGAGIPT